jgi:O-antigen/teichoic acid export membrane protein
MNRDFLLVSTGRLITALIGIITIRVATTYLSPAQYGELAMLIAVQTFCGLLLVNPVGQHINRHTHQWWDDGTLLIRLASYSRYIFGVAVVGAAAVFVFVVQATITQTLFAALVILLMVNAATWNTTSVYMLNMLGFRASSVFWAIVSVIISLLASFILVIWMSGATAWLCGQALGLTIGAMGAGRALRIHTHQADLPTGIHSLLDREVIFKYCLPLAIATGLMWLQLSGYRFVVRAYWGVEMLGYAAVGLLLASQLFALIETLAQQFLLPMFYRRITKVDTHSNRAAMSDLLNFMGPLYLVLAGSILLGAPYILKLLTSAQYADAEIFVRFGVGIECCRVLGNLLGQAAQITKTTHSLVLPYAAGAIGVIGLMLLAGEYSAGIGWVGGTLLLAAIVTLTGMVWAMYRQVPFTLDARRWLLGLLTMIILFIPAWWLDRPQSWRETIGMLVMIGLVSSGIMLSMIRNNVALKRMMAVNLREVPR